MVIASNEWLNNYEDEQKSASVNTTSTTTNTINTPPATSSTAASTAAVNTTNNTVSTATTISTTSTSTSTTPRTESEASTPTTDNNITNPNSDVQQTEHQQQQQPHSMINNKVQMMDESLKVVPETNEIENNNKEAASSTSKNNSSSSQSYSNTSLQTIVSNSTNNLTTNVNSNTAIANQQSTTNIQSPIFNPNPITPQALSNALQSALNATSNNVTVSVNLPNSFLSSLGSVGISPNATLQHTANLAKQLSSSLCALESHTNSNNFKKKALDNNADLSMREYQQTTDNNGEAKIVLHCEPNSHPFQTRVILLTPNIECKVGRLIAKSKASESNAIFDCKVLSRNHAVLWYSNDGKFWVKDTSSSNGTFINESKLGIEASELHFGDVVKFGVDVMENSRKEVHGCIIAGVKLYLPDGRETISIESSSNQLSPHSGEGRISFDELHRLNLYMQEASQREKVLKSKLFNIQNILDATRKNSALCWQSMIAEDQLLHRIHSLEKKLQLMEKNVPENVLRNEVLKLIDDKNSYQHSAKEALRKVYQERCDAMQMLSKMESAVTASDNECKILRDQIMTTKQSLQDVNSRLLSLETEYNEFKGQNDRRQQEAREQSDQQAAEMVEKLQQRESECELLKRKISELLLKRADLLDEEQLQKQAIEKLDAAIADMDLGDDDDEEDDDDEDDDEENDNERNDKHHDVAVAKELAASVVNKADAINGKSAKKNAASDSGSDEEKTNSPKLNEEPQDGTKRSGGQKSTILKWLENSDLNKKEGSLDIFDAICNESDSSDDTDNGAGTNEAKNNNKSSTTIDNNKVEHFETQYLNFNNKLHSVQQNLTKLEAEIASKSNETSNDIAAAQGGISSTVIVEEEEDDESDDENDDDSEISAEDDQHNEIITKRNAKKGVALLHSNDNKSYTLLKNSVIMLREAYNEICLNMQQQKASQLTKPTISMQSVQYRQNSKKRRKCASKRVLEAQATLKFTSDSEENDVDDNDDVVSQGTARLSAASLQTIEEIVTARGATAQLEQTADRSSSNNREKQKQNSQLEAAIKLYQKQIEELQAKLDLNENDAHNTLEIMQIECDAFKDKVEELTKIIETLSDEKQALQQVINENKSNAQKTAECCKDKLVVITEQLLQQPMPEENVKQNELENVLLVTTGIEPTTNNTKANTFELEMCEELAAINNVSVQREEELIMYKERLEQTQSDNLRLRNEISDLMRKSNDYTKTMLKRMAPYGVVVVAILVYFIITYF